MLVPCPEFDDSPYNPSGSVGRIHYEDTAIFALGSTPSPAKEWYLDAIKNAKEYIYIENQYFEDDDIVKALIEWYLSMERQKSRSEFHAAVVLPRIADPQVYYQQVAERNIRRIRLATADVVVKDNHGQIRLPRPIGGWGPSGGRLSRTPGPIVEFQGGIKFYTMIAKNAFEFVYVHAKVGIIDDGYMVGSSNIATQSFRDDSEADVAVEDANETMIFREKLWMPLVGGFHFVSIREWFNAFATVGGMNPDREQQGLPPQGLLYEYPL